VAWAKEAVALGAGELLVTSIDHDGERAGYDLALTRAIADAVDVPVIASGGAGTGAHLVAAFREGHAEAALVAGVLHDGTATLGALKSCLDQAGLDVRGLE
jgi:imidazole glycerol-phosphate synthase subunit HisF